VTSCSEASCPVRSFAMGPPRTNRYEIKRLARAGAGVRWAGVRILAALFLFIGGWAGIVGVAIYVASHDRAQTQTQSTIGQAIFFPSAACAIAGSVLFILNGIVLRVWLAVWGVGIIAMITSGYAWNSYFGWYNWGGAFQYGPFLRQVVIPALLYGVIVSICARIARRFGVKQEIIGSGSGK
jgi:hypothetical protein